MLFHSATFMLLASLTGLIFYRLPRHRLALLALANAVFYGAAGVKYLVLFLGMSAVTYVAARTQRPAAIWTAVAVVSLNLIFFKYAAFALDNLHALFGLTLIADAFFHRLLLPVGISFYTFQLIAYLVDVRKGEVQPARSFLEFWVFISFFAQLVAGPILRGRDFLPQVERVREIRFSGENLRWGLFFFGLGLIKKRLGADNLAPAVDHLFGLDHFTFYDAWLAAILFGFQIYLDFSGYSDMALGLGRLFGLHLKVNFLTPYVSTNPAEFWRRWNITLSQWIRDYIYIPLGGSRRGRLRNYANLIAAMAFSGLWHGAAWTFVAWGLVHGFWQAGQRALRDAGNRWPGFSRRIAGAPRPVAWTASFLALSATWVFFRSESLAQAGQILAAMTRTADLSLQPTDPLLVLAAVLLVVLHWAEYGLLQHREAVLAFWGGRVPAPVRGAMTALALVLFVIFTAQGVGTFIYFQF